MTKILTRCITAKKALWISLSVDYILILSVAYQISFNYEQPVSKLTTAVFFLDGWADMGGIQQERLLNVIASGKTPKLIW